MTIAEHLNQNYRELEKLRKLIETQTNDLASSEHELSVKEDWISRVEAVGIIKGKETSMLELPTYLLPVSRSPDSYNDFTQTAL